MLAELADPTGPAERDRVRLAYSDGSTVEGEWRFVGGDVGASVLFTDDGRVHGHVTGQVQRQVLRRAERPRLALLTASEAHVVAARCWRSSPVSTRGADGPAGSGHGRAPVRPAGGSDW